MSKDKERLRWRTSKENLWKKWRNRRAKAPAEEKYARELLGKAGKAGKKENERYEKERHRKENVLYCKPCTYNLWYVAGDEP